MLHLNNIIGGKISLENIDLSDIEKRNSLVGKTPTTTLPFLETKEGNISESKAIDYYLCTKYKPELLGETTFEKAKVNQWVEFACCEVNRCCKNVVYPIFGWREYCKESFDKDNAKIKDYVKIIEKELSNNEYITGKKLTLADVLLFRYLRFFMMFHFPDGMRKSFMPKTTKWFEKIMTTPEAVKAYGRTVLCKNSLKPFTGKVNRAPSVFTKKDKKEENVEKSENVEKEVENAENAENVENENEENGGKKGKKGKKGKDKGKDKGKQNQDKGKGKQNQNKTTEKKELVKEIKKSSEPYVPGLLEVPRFNLKKKENNPLDALPQSKFDLAKFKTDFLQNTNKKSAMKKFWKDYDPEGYSLWHIEYNNEPNECITLFRTVIIKGDILLQLEYFKPYCFGVLGVYGSDGDYKISGCLLWRGNEIPDEIKEINCYNKLTLRKLDTKDQKERQLVHDYWTKIKENEKVFKRPAIDTRYFH